MKQRGKPKKKRMALVPRAVFATVIAGVVPIAASGCGPTVVSLDAGTFDSGMPDHGIVSLDAGTFDAGMPDHGIIVSLDAGTFDAGMPDHGIVDLDGSASG